jgi:hypothetical protein
MTLKYLKFKMIVHKTFTSVFVEICPKIKGKKFDRKFFRTKLSFIKSIPGSFFATAGLSPPDGQGCLIFSWNNIPKRGKYGQKYTKWVLEYTQMEEN